MMKNLIKVQVRVTVCLAFSTISYSNGEREPAEKNTYVKIRPQQAIIFTEKETSGPLYYPRDLLVTDDGIWVLDAGNHRILLIRKETEPIVIGRKGSGPGEFKAPVALIPRLKGGVTVWDRSLWRVTSISRSGELEGTKLIEIPFLEGLDITKLFPLED